MTAVLPEGAISPTMGADHDVIVIGAGNAALCAALSATESGARVLVLEKSPYAYRGGNTRLTGGLMRSGFGDPANLDTILDERIADANVRVPAYGEADFLDDLRRMSNDHCDPDLAATLVAQAFPTLQWLHGHGVKFILNRALGSVATDGTGEVFIPRGSVIRAQGQGAGLSAALFAALEARQVEIRYNTEVWSFVQDVSGAIRGVRVRDTDGLHDLRAGAVVMASGGFEANPRLRTGYLGADWSRVLVRGVPYNTGRVTEAALDIGAQAHGDWSACHATIVDIDAPPFSEPGVADYTSRLSYPLSVMVNLDGKRFVDEAEHFHHFTYAKYGRAILAQRRGLAIEIFDAKVIERLAPQYSIWPGDPVEADTIEDLALRLAERLPDAGLDTEQLVRTVAEFNAATSGGAFDPTRLDGLATTDVHPAKTNWAQPIDAPPYRAYIVQCGITFTYGGIRIDPDGSVLDFQGRPIPGLYGAGEVVGGLFYDNYPGGAGLAAGAVFGRRAGSNAAARATARRV